MLSSVVKSVVASQLSLVAGLVPVCFGELPADWIRLTLIIVLLLFAVGFCLSASPLFVSNEEANDQLMMISAVLTLCAVPITVAMCVVHLLIVQGSSPGAAECPRKPAAQ
ncbi:unnamed protein product [Victoria cruziana]